MGESMRYSVPRLYYRVTPGFILLDYFAGLNVRVAVLDDLPHIVNLLLAAGIAAFAFLQRNKALSDRFEAATRGRQTNERT